MSLYVPIRAMSARFPMIIPHTALAYACYMRVPSFHAPELPFLLLSVIEGYYNENGAKCP